MPYHEVICRAKRQTEAAKETEIEAAIETAKKQKNGSQEREARSEKRRARGKGGG
jgi:hypothetical protein